MVQDIAFLILNLGRKEVPIFTFKLEENEKMYLNVELHGDGEWWEIQLL